MFEFYLMLIYGTIDASETNLDSFGESSVVINGVTVALDGDLLFDARFYQSVVLFLVL